MYESIYSDRNLYYAYQISYLLKFFFLLIPL